MHNFPYHRFFAFALVGVVWLGNNSPTASAVEAPVREPFELWSNQASNLLEEADLFRSASNATSEPDSDCKGCDWVFDYHEDSQGNAHFFTHFCKSIRLGMGYEDCFEPMLPWLECSMYGPERFCYGGEVSLDRTTRIDGRGVLESRSARLLATTMFQASAEQRSPEAGIEATVRSCKGSIVLRNYAPREADELRRTTSTIAL